MSGTKRFERILCATSGVFVAILMIVAFMSIKDVIVSKEPMEKHIEAVHNMHVSLHETKVPHPWFHAFPRNNKRERMAH